MNNSDLSLATEQRARDINENSSVNSCLNWIIFDKIYVPGYIYYDPVEKIQLS